MKIFDLLVLLALTLSFYKGLKNRFIQSVFRTLGYIAGGLVGIVVAKEVINTWTGVLAKVVSSAILILLFAKLGEFFLGKVSLHFREVPFIVPFKILGSLLGASLAIARTTFIIYLIALILIATPWRISDDYIVGSKFYSYSYSFLPKVVTDLNIYLNNLLY